MRTQQFESLVSTWQKCYTVIYKTRQQYKARLKELETWDTSNNNKIERAAKIQALKNLIENK